MNEQNNKDDYFYDGHSSDISFCSCDCKCLKCHRNANGEFFKSLSYGWYSFADFKDYCVSYLAPKGKDND